MAVPAVTPRAKNFPQWYQEVIGRAPDLYDEAPVTGCITFGPLATALWGKIKADFDARIRAMGVENILLPTLIPESFFAREKEHVEGFTPEAAVVTHAGGEKLSEPYYVRPTSELLFVDWFARSGRVQSHRDLPLLVNQWCSVLRWEKRPRAFLRTTEFHWQEGHCLFPTEAQCRAFTRSILDQYAALSEQLLAIPVVKGTKPTHERFPGAIDTYTIESMMQDGKALQMGTSHMLNQSFLTDSAGKPRVSFLDASEKTQIPYYDSWGISTRLLGALVMAHGDDEGIVLPPRVAPVQVAVLPVFGSNEKENEAVLTAARALAQAISQTSHVSSLKSQVFNVHGRSQWFSQVDGNLTVRVDERPDQRLGEKTFHQIRSGTPVRIELGARDLQERSCIVKSRIRSREAAVKAPIAEAAGVVTQMLDEDQKMLFERAKKFAAERTVQPTSYAELKSALAEGKWAAVSWDGTQQTVDQLKADTSGGTIRCFAFDAPEDAKGEKDLVSGKPSTFEQKVIVAKAY